jgi:hypothetical protein
MNIKGFAWIALIAVATCLAYAATMLGKVTGAAVKYTDELGAQCCDRLTNPNEAAADLMKACESLGGSFYKNPRFLAPYCGTHLAGEGKGWKYYCDRAVEADCYK